VGKIDPDLIVLNETLYRNNERTKLKNYRSFNKNRENKNGGGIEILIKNSMENRTITISEGSQEIEELTIRTETRKRAINIITLHGKIEGRVNREKIREQFTHLEELINSIESAGEDYILIGDLNAKIGNGENGIAGNKEEINEAGKSLLKLEKNVEGIIVNKTEKCEGKWTRINTQKETEKAILDYTMTNENLYEDVTRMKIDEEKLFRLTKYKRRNIKETDHNTIIIEINDEIKKQKRDQQRRWKTYSKQGWEKFKDTTEEHPELDNTWKTNNIQKEWNNWLKITNRILQESFGKVRIQENRRQEMDNETKTLIERKREIRKKVNRAQKMEDKE